MKKLLNIWLISFFLLSSSILKGQVLVSSQKIGTLPANLITLIGIVNAKYNVEIYKVTYNVTNIDGQPGIASGMICIPVKPACDSLPIVLYEHGTVLEDTDVPSYNNEEALVGKSYASLGYVAVMPDYIGLGDSPGLHPYMHAASEAEASVQILRAAKEFIQNKTSFIYNNQIFITGYSQGGHAAMATTKYIEDNNLLSELNVVASAPASGPYNMSGRQIDVVIDDLVYPNSGFVVYVLMSYQMVYGNIYNSPGDVLVSPYDTMMPPLFDGTHSFAEVNDSLPDQVSQFMQPAFLQAFIADTTTKSLPLWVATKDNDVYNWGPQTRMHLIYCQGDKVVFPDNTHDAYAAMVANAAKHVSKQNLGNLGHSDCAVPAFKNAIVLFESMKDTCGTATGIALAKPLDEMSVYPNPASNNVRIELKTGSENNVRIFDASGRIVLVVSSFDDQLNVDVSGWTPGLYFVLVEYENGKAAAKFLVN